MIITENQPIPKFREPPSFFCLLGVRAASSPACTPHNTLIKAEGQFPD